MWRGYPLSSTLSKDDHEFEETLGSRRRSEGLARRASSDRRLDRSSPVWAASFSRHQTARLHRQLLQFGATAWSLAAARKGACQRYSFDGAQLGTHSRSGYRPRDLASRCCGARKVDALKRGSPAFATMRSLAMCFNAILRGRRPEPLDAWIDEAIESELIPIMRFARVLRRDIDAVYNAIELPGSNGQAEGQINRLKTLKRAMYGRAGTEFAKGANASTAPHKLRQNLLTCHCTHGGYAGRSHTILPW